MSIIAIIPARGGSKGIPNKNIKLLNGEPLISYTIKEAKKSSFLDQIYVSTDDDNIKEIALSYGAEVPCFRPVELATDDAPTLPVIQHMTKISEELIGNKVSIIVTLQPTSPLRTTMDIDKTIKTILTYSSDSAVSVFEVNTHPYLTASIRNDKLCWLYSENKRTRRQNLPKMYALNGAVYATDRDILMNYNSLYGKDTRAYIMPMERSLDIDTLFQFHLVELIIQNGLLENEEKNRNSDRN